MSQYFIYTCIFDLLRAKWCNSFPKNSPIMSAPHMTFLLRMSTCTLLFSIPRGGSVTWQQPRDWPWRWSQRCTLKEVLKCAFLMPYCEKIQYLSYQCNQGIQKPFVSNLQMGYIAANALANGNSNFGLVLISHYSIFWSGLFFVFGVLLTCYLCERSVKLDITVIV